ncbi:Fpg/Nei family DNA glycosylase [Ornithinimicrobium sp. Arc0846-15]|nr:Fpg/Nei family DNA glycosylase [Ornithinimicrobium laminariae]
MPEGHTIHRLAGDLNIAFSGEEPEVTSPQGRFSEGAATVDQTKFVAARAWGKQLFIEFADEKSIHVHLGLIGKFSVNPLLGELLPDPVGQVRLRLATSDAVADLRGPMVCATVTPDEVSAVIAKLGPDPLRAEADPDVAWAKVHRANRSIAELLMDQSVVAGIGNVYRSEVLHRHQVNPLFAGKRIKRKTWDVIWDDLVRMMPVGVATGRIITNEKQLVAVEAKVEALGLGSGDSARVNAPRPKPYAYKQTGKGCSRCGSIIKTKVVAGRNLFWCANCQRRT